MASRNPKDLSQFVYQKEVKGLDIVRRDWCLLAKQIGEKVLNEILSGQSCDTVLTNINKILNDTADKIKNNSFDLKLFEMLGTYQDVMRVFRCIDEGQTIDILGDFT